MHISKEFMQYMHQRKVNIVIRIDIKLKIKSAETSFVIFLL